MRRLSISLIFTVSQNYPQPLPVGFGDNLPHSEPGGTIGQKKYCRKKRDPKFYFAEKMTWSFDLITISDLYHFSSSKKK